MGIFLIVFFIRLLSTYAPETSLCVVTFKLSLYVVFSVHEIDFLRTKKKSLSFVETRLIHVAVIDRGMIRSDMQSGDWLCVDLWMVWLTWLIVKNHDRIYVEEANREFIILSQDRVRQLNTAWLVRPRIWNMQLREKTKTKHIWKWRQKNRVFPWNIAIFAFYNRKKRLHSGNKSSGKQNPRTEKSINKNMLLQSESCECIGIPRKSRKSWNLLHGISAKFWHSHEVIWKKILVWQENLKYQNIKSQQD